MRELMPLTSAWVDTQRLAHGTAYVDACIRRSLKGERNMFYAVEAGHFLGAPFDWETKGLYVVSMGILSGAKFIAAFRDPKDTVHMVVQPPSQEVPDGSH
jgi:hypothetical protein